MSTDITCVVLNCADGDGDGWEWMKGRLRAEHLPWADGKGGEDRGERGDRSLRGVNLAQENVPFPFWPSQLNLGEVQLVSHLLMPCFGKGRREESVSQGVIQGWLKDLMEAPLLHCSEMIHGLRDSSLMENFEETPRNGDFLGKHLGM